MMLGTCINRPSFLFMTLEPGCAPLLPNLPRLPLPGTSNLETRPVLKKTAEAHRYLAELKGFAASIPNEAILINNLVLQEAKDSSEIENIINSRVSIRSTMAMAAQGASSTCSTWWRKICRICRCSI